VMLRARREWPAPLSGRWGRIRSQDVVHVLLDFLENNTWTPFSLKLQIRNKRFLYALASPSLWTGGIGAESYCRRALLP
jgi:hypothetical protein